MTIEYIKQLGKNKSGENFDFLLEIYNQELPIEIKREVVSSIGRQKDDNKVYNFFIENAFKKNYMDIIYQMFRTTLYRYDIDKFARLCEDMKSFYKNEIMDKMYD